MKNCRTGLAAACSVPFSTAALKTGGSASWITVTFLSNKEQNVFKGNVTEMCMQNNAFKGFKYVFKLCVDLYFSMKIAISVFSRRLIKIASFLEKDYICSYPDHISGDVNWYKIQCLDQYCDNKTKRTEKMDKSTTLHRNVDSLTICLTSAKCFNRFSLALDKSVNKLNNWSHTVILGYPALFFKLSTSKMSHVFLFWAYSEHVPSPVYSS